MQKRYRYVFFTIIALILIASISLTIAFLHTNSELEDNRLIGKVEVAASMYHGTVATPAKLVKIIDNNTNEEFSKPGIYAVNVSDPSDDYYIDKLRAFFLIESNVDTYIRVKLVISEILTYVNNNGELVEIATNIDDIIFGLNEDWYYDANDQYYYIKEKVMKDGTNETKIDFIIEGLNYVPKSPQYSVQINLKYEAVQAHLGPQKNWGLTNPPWGGNW